MIEQKAYDKKCREYRKELMEYYLKYRKYGYSSVLRGKDIIKLTVTRHLCNNKYFFTIYDSYCMVTTSLSDIGQNFDVLTKKSIFPYKFAK